MLAFFYLVRNQRREEAAMGVQEGGYIESAIIKVLMAWLLSPLEDKSRTTSSTCYKFKSPPKKSEML